MDEGGPGDIGGERRKPRVVLGVDLLREPLLLRAVTRDVVADCRHVSALLKPRDDLLANRLVSGVDVVHVNCGGVRRPRLPQVRDGAREQPQHAPHALEVAERRRLAGERRQHLRVQRIACPERLGALGPCRVGRERIAVCCPERAVPFDRGLDARSVDALEQAPAQHLDGLVLFGRIEQRGLARGHALRFAHLIGDELILLAVGVARPSVLADREGVDERGVRCAFDSLEQRGQECGELVPRIPHPPDLSQVDRELVEEDERRLATEQLAQGLRPGRNARLVALAEPLVAIFARERTGDLAPRRVGQYAVAHGPAVGRIGVLAVEGGDAHSAPAFKQQQQRRVDELGDVRHGPEPACGVREGDQAVGLAPAIGGIEAEDRSDPRRQPRPADGRRSRAGSLVLVSGRCRRRTVSGPGTPGFPCPRPPRPDRLRSPLPRSRPGARRSAACRCRTRLESSSFSFRTPLVSGLAGVSYSGGDASAGETSDRPCLCTDCTFVADSSLPTPGSSSHSIAMSVSIPALHGSRWKENFDGPECRRSDR